jgi:hypothetical protein
MQICKYVETAKAYDTSKIKLYATNKNWIFMLTTSMNWKLGTNQLSAFSANDSQNLKGKGYTWHFSS